MLRFSSFLLAAALSCGAVLMTDSTANAQRRGGGGGRGGGGYHSSGGHYSGGGHYYGGGGHYYGGYGGYHHSGFYVRPGYYGSGRYSNYYSPGVYTEDEPYYGGEYAEEEPVPAETVVPATPADGSVTRLSVILPQSRGTLWIDGLKIDSPTQTQNVEFPSETAGAMYPHKVVATIERDGRMVTEERQVNISGGKTSVVDFTRSVQSTSNAPRSKVPPPPKPDSDR